MGFGLFSFFHFEKNNVIGPLAVADPACRLLQIHTEMTGPNQEGSPSSFSCLMPFSVFTCPFGQGIQARSKGCCMGFRCAKTTCKEPMYC